MRNKGKTRKFFRTETEDRKCFPDIETARPEYAIYPELSSSSSHTFMYVQNYETRDYQVEISLSSVTKNTLIIISTGLGKTFIAAMIIINFYRWFPTGKIIFLATSRPLVKQQMDSIKQFNIISKKDIVEITGGVNQSVRTNYWKNSRVFFATPQTIQKDIERGVCPVSQIVLIVVDEAHHARGNHSYCQIIRKVAEVTKFFRVIALTATPGSTVYDIQQVIFNLLISQIEIRTDDDCAKYIHSREIKNVLIQDAPGVSELSARLNSILQIYLEKLLKMSLVTTKDPTRTSKGKIALLMKTQHMSTEANIAIKQSIRLLNLREKLENYSIPIFTHDLEEFVNSSDRPNDDTEEEIKMLLAAAKRSPQKDPKMEKLCEIVVNFLETSNEKSKIIVFCSYRNVVKEIVENLKKASPIIKCAEFVGQSSSSAGLRGLNQSKQLKVMDAFKRGIFNVLISTSIGEEGLDIGEVDLIICYDVQKSSTRTIQRMGRTGRHQDGSVIFLLSEASKNLLHNAEKATDSTSILISKNINEFEFYDCPKMNENKLTIIYKKFTAEEIKKINKEKEVKRAVLLTSELEELHEHHGDSLFYPKFELDSSIDYIAGAIFCSQIKMSAESILLSDVYSSIFQSSIQCSPFKSLSLNSQFQNSVSKQKDKSLIDENENSEIPEKSPFAIDESSSQIKYTSFSPISSQKKPRKVSIKETLGIDISTDSFYSDSDSDSDIFAHKNKKTKISSNSSDDNENENEILKKNASKELKNTVLELKKEVSENEKTNKKRIDLGNSSNSDSDTSFGFTSSSSTKSKKESFNTKKSSLKLPNAISQNQHQIEKEQEETEPFKILADIDEISISSDSKGSNNYTTAENTSGFKRSFIDIDEGDSGFIPPNTKSYSTTSNSSSKAALVKKNKDKKSVSLISGSETDFEEEEEETSLSGFIVKSSEEVIDSQKIIKKMKHYSYSYSSSEEEKKYDKKRFNSTRNYKKEEVEEEDDDDDVLPLNQEEVSEMTQKFSNSRNSHQIQLHQNEQEMPPPFPDFEEENKEEDEVFPLNPNEDTEITQNRFPTQKNFIQISSESSDNSQKENESQSKQNVLRIFTQNDLEKIIHEEDEKEENKNKENSSSDDYEIITESSSFVSTSSELIKSESSDFEEEEFENGNQINSSHSISSDRIERSNRYLKKMMEEDEEDESDHEIKRKVRMSSKNYRRLLNDYQNSEEEDFSLKNKPKVPVENISFVPLSKLIGDQNAPKLKKIKIPQKSSSDFEDSTD